MRMRSLSIRRFEFEQAAFALEAPSVAAEMSRSAERAMAGDYNRDRICAIGGADGANRTRSSDTSRDFGVRASFAAWDCAELVPYAPLKRSAADIEWQIQYHRTAPEIFRDSPRPFAGECIVAPDRGFWIVGAKLGNDRSIRVAQGGETDTMASTGNEEPSQHRFPDRISDARAAAAWAVGANFAGYCRHGTI
jgi:hypothetical protein